MIKSQAEYEMALRRIRDDEEVAALQRAKFVAAGLTEDEVNLAMQPLLSFHAQLRDETRWYERIVAGDFSTLDDLDALGRLLIAIRIELGITQEELATRLGVSAEDVIRNERDEYYGFTVEELRPIITALGRRIRTQVEPQPRRELAYAD